MDTELLILESTILGAEPDEGCVGSCADGGIGWDFVPSLVLARAVVVVWLGRILCRIVQLGRPALRSCPWEANAQSCARTRCICSLGLLVAR